MAGFVPAAGNSDQIGIDMLTTIFHAIIMIGIAIAGLAIFLWAALEIIDFIRWIFPVDRDR